MKHLFTLSTFVIIALAFWGLQSYEEKTQAIVSDTFDPHFVDVFMRDFKLTAMDEDGKPSYTLQASQFEHYNDETLSQIKQPEIRLLQNSHRWLITAKTGEIDDDNQRIILHDDVVLVQQETDSPVRIETSKLEIDTEKQIARSEQLVDIQLNELRLKSKGMVLNNITGELELLASVKGNYVPAN